MFSLVEWMLFPSTQKGLLHVVGCEIVEGKLTTEQYISDMCMKVEYLLMPCFCFRTKVARVSQEPSTGTAVIGEMSINNGEEPIQASSESFWEVGKYVRTVNRIDNGYKLCSSLKQLITSRAEIERAYAKQLTQWSKKWNEFLDKGVYLIIIKSFLLFYK